MEIISTHSSGVVVALSVAPNVLAHRFSANSEDRIPQAVQAENPVQLVVMPQCYAGGFRPTAIYAVSAQVKPPPFVSSTNSEIHAAPSSSEIILLPTARRRV